MKELLGWSFDGALDPWSCFLIICWDSPYIILNFYEKSGVCSSNKTKGLKLHRGHSSFYQCLPFYPVYLMNLSFAPYTFLPNLPFYPVYLSNLSFAPCTFIPNLPIKPITHSISPVISILPCNPVYLLNL